MDTKNKNLITCKEGKPKMNISKKHPGIISTTKCPSVEIVNEIERVYIQEMIHKALCSVVVQMQCDMVNDVQYPDIYSYPTSTKDLCIAMENLSCRNVIQKLIRRGYNKMGKYSYIYANYIKYYPIAKKSDSCCLCIVRNDIDDMCCLEYVNTDRLSCYTKRKSVTLMQLAEELHISI